MCLAVPMRIQKILSADKALVGSKGLTVEADVSLLSNPALGDYVIIHAGYAIETLTGEDAEERIRMAAEVIGDEFAGGNPSDGDNSRHRSRRGTPD